MNNQIKYALYVQCRLGKGYVKFMGPQTNYGIVGSAICLADVTEETIFKHEQNTKRVLFDSKQKAESFKPLISKIFFSDSEISVKEMESK